MKRPLAVIGYTYLAALTVALFFGVSSVGVIAVCLLLGLAVVLKSGRLRRTVVLPAIGLTALSAMGMLWLYTGVFVTPTQYCYDQTVQMEAELCESPYRQYDRYYYPLQAQELRLRDGTVVSHVRVLVSSAQPLSMDYFDYISAEVHFGRDTEDYRLAKGIMLTGYLTDPEQAIVTPTAHKPLFYYALQARSFLSGILYDTLPSEQAAFVSALLLGDRSGVDTEVQEHLRTAGLSHILVVSGMHLSFLTGLCLFVLQRLLLRRNLALSLCMLLVALYMAITGFSPSVVRAGIMQLIVLAGMLLGESSDAYHSLGLAVLVMTLRNPYAALDISLLLSFSATLGLIFAANKLTSFGLEHTGSTVELYSSVPDSVVGRLRRGLLKMVGVTAAAYLFTLPVTILYFRRLSLYAIPANMAVAPILPLLMTASVLLLLLHGGVIFPPIVGFLVQYIDAVAAQTEQWPMSVLQLSQRFVPWWLAGMGLLAVILLLCKGKRYRVRILALTGVLSLILGVVLTEWFDYQVVRIAVLDTGQGSTVLLVQNNQAVVLSCGGSYSNYSAVKDYLTGTQIQSLSLLLLTDRDWSSSAYADHLLTDFPTEQAVIYDRQRWSLSVQECLMKAEHCLSCDSKTDSIQRVVYEDKTIVSYWDKTHHAVYVDLDGYRVLLCHGETDAALLPDTWQQGDLLILHGRIDHKQALSYGTTIIADAVENYRQYLSLAQQENTWRTWEGQHIIVRLSPDHQTEIRRERLWVS